MKTLQEIVEILKQHKKYLNDKFKVREIKLFGSYVRGEQKEASDIDIIIDFEKVPTFIEFMKVQEELERLLGVKVDLLTEEGISPFIRPYIKEVVTI